MGIAAIIQMLLLALPLLLKLFQKNQRADIASGPFGEIRAKRIERILGLCGKCRAAASPAGFVPDDQVSDDGTDPSDPEHS